MGMKALAMVWLKVNNKEIDGWYQGEKAYEQTGADRLNGWSAVLNRSKELTGNNPALAAATDIAELMAATPITLQV